MMKARVKYPTEDKKNAGKKTVTAGTLSNGEMKCNGNGYATTEPPKVDNCPTLDQRNLQTEKTAPQIDPTPPAPVQGSSNGTQSNHNLHQADLAEAGTVEKHETESPKKTPTAAPTKQQILSFIESEPVFDRAEHRLEVMAKIRSYVRDVKRSDILQILNNQVFDEEGNVEEIVKVMEEFVKEKTNNNLSNLAM